MRPPTQETRSPRPHPAVAEPVPDPAPRLRPLSIEECWAQLRHHGEGRLGYLTGRGPRHAVLRYAVRDFELVLRVPAYNEAAQFANGRRVTFDVSARFDGRTDERTDERIEVAGQARVVEPDGSEPEPLPDQSGPPDWRGRLVYLRVDEVCGETERTRRS